MPPHVSEQQFETDVVEALTTSGGYTLGGGDPDEAQIRFKLRWSTSWIVEGRSTCSGPAPSFPLPRTR